MYEEGLKAKARTVVSLAKWDGELRSWPTFSATTRVTDTGWHTYGRDAIYTTRTLYAVSPSNILKQKSHNLYHLNGIEKPSRFRTAVSAGYVQSQEILACKLACKEACSGLFLNTDCRCTFFLFILVCWTILMYWQHVRLRKEREWNIVFFKCSCSPFCSL